MSLREQLRVMVVDDTATSRGLITEALSTIGVTHVRSANSAAAALTDLASHPAHLVISDMNMPGMDGLQFLDALRTSPRTSKIAFMLITGRATQEILAEGRKLGMNNFVTKPFQSKDLLKAIEAIVGRI